MTFKQLRHKTRKRHKTRRFPAPPPQIRLKKSSIGALNAYINAVMSSSQTAHEAAGYPFFPCKTYIKKVSPRRLQLRLPPTRWQTDAVAVAAQLQQSALFKVAFPFLHAGFLLVHLVDDDVQLSFHDIDLPLRQLLLPPPQLLLLLPLLLSRPCQRLLP